MDTPKQILKKYERDGYCIARNVIEKQIIENILNNVCQNYFKRNPKSKFMKEKKPWKNISFNEEMSKFRDEKSELFSEVYDSCLSSISAAQLTTSKIISKIVSIILKCKTVELSHVRNQVRMDTPFDKRNTTKWHQDVKYFYNPGVVLWTPLVKHTEKMGLLNILEKSHLEGEVPYGANNYSTEKYLHQQMVHTSRVSHWKIQKKTLEKCRKKYRLKKVSINEGDALFFSMNLLHKSGTNISKKIRFTYQSRFFNSISSEFAALVPKLILNPYSAKKLGRRFP